jgi:hypothetical protein
MKVDHFNLEQGITSLYYISLEYYTLLKKKDHPKLELITIIMDKLIELKKEKDLSPESMKERYDLIHSLAYTNIQVIYDYDKEQLELNGEKVEVLPLDVRIELNEEKIKEITHDQVSREDNKELDQHENIKFTHSIQ